MQSYSYSGDADAGRAATPHAALGRAAVQAVQATAPRVLPDDLEVEVRSRTRGVLLMFLVPREQAAAALRSAPPDDAPPAPRTSDELRECDQDIARILGQAGERLTGEVIKRRLQEAELRHGDSTIDHSLADLVKRRKLLTNRRDSYGRDYGLADWS
jgi:hypothetical protein